MIMDDYSPWTEKYRPHTLGDIIGQKEIVESLKSFVKERNMPNLLFTGPPGCGKTTATLALAKEMFGADYKASTLELNASDERGIDVVRGHIKDFSRMVSMSGHPFKIIFLDEADSLTPDAQHALRRTMEVNAGITRFILSCNYSSKIIEPIQSRCSVFRFKQLENKDILGLIDRICEAEKLKCDKEARDAIAYICDGDMRKAVNILQGAALLTKHITVDTVYRTSSRAKPAEVKQMIELAYSGKFAMARKKLEALMIEYGMSAEDVLSAVYKEVQAIDIPDLKKVEIVDALGEINFRVVEGANERIQLEALLAKIVLFGSKKE